jgi:hypothetical protein
VFRRKSVQVLLIFLTPVALLVGLIVVDHFRTPNDSEADLRRIMRDIAPTASPPVESRYDPGVCADSDIPPGLEQVYVVDATTPEAVLALIERNARAQGLDQDRGELVASGTTGRAWGDEDRNRSVIATVEPQSGGAVRVTIDLGGSQRCGLLP